MIDIPHRPSRGYGSVPDGGMLQAWQTTTDNTSQATYASASNLLSQ